MTLACDYTKTATSHTTSYYTHQHAGTSAASTAARRRVMAVSKGDMAGASSSDSGASGAGIGAGRGDDDFRRCRRFFAAGGGASGALSSSSPCANLHWRPRAVMGQVVPPDASQCLQSRVR